MYSLEKEKKVNKNMLHISKILNENIYISLTNRLVVVEDTKTIIKYLIKGTPKQLNQAKAINYRIHLISQIRNVDKESLDNIKYGFQKLINSSTTSYSRFKKNVLLAVNEINKNLGLSSEPFKDVYKQFHLNFANKLSLLISWDKF